MAKICQKNNDLKQKYRTATTRNNTVATIGFIVSVIVGIIVFVLVIGNIQTLGSFTMRLTEPFVYDGDSFLLMVLLLVPNLFFKLLGVLMPLGLPVVAYFLCMILFGSMMDENPEVIRSGIEGEEAALHVLSDLPDDVHIFTNVKVTYEGKCSEADLVTVSPGGITIIEVKNYSGEITGDRGAHDLIRTKEYQTDTFYNPLRQVKTHAYRLSGYLRSRGVDCWVNTAVYFANKRASVKLTGENVGVAVFVHESSDDLCEFVMSPSQKGGIGKEQAEKIAGLLKQM